MKKAKLVSKRALSLLMTIALLMTTLVFFDIGATMAFAAKDPITVTDSGSGDKVYFYVPEQVYLKPSLNAHKNQERANFQWFVDAEIDKNTHEISKLNTGEKTSGNLYFYYRNASSVSITFKYLNSDFKEMQAYTSTSESTSTKNYANMNSSIKFSTYSNAISPVNTRTDSSRTRYSLNSNLIDTTITNESVSPYIISTESGCYIEWTATFVDSLDGLTKNVVAYTYVYKPNIMPAGNAMFIKNDRGYDHDNSAISWISGFHSLNNYAVGKYYPVVGQGNNRSILPFSSTNPEGYKVMSNSYNRDTDQYAQWAAYPMSNGYFAWDGSQLDNVDGNYFVTDNMSNSIFTIPSFNLYENRNSGPTGGDITFLNYGVSPQTQIMVDTSRYGNLSQIPNLTVGLMGTSNWSESGAVTGAWIVSDVKSSNGDSHYTSQLNTTSEGEARWYNYNSIIASGEDPYNPTGEGGTEGIKYNGKINKNISGMTSTNACNVQASIYNEQGQDTGFNISILRLNVTANNKDTLRDAFNAANAKIAYLGLNNGTSPYYKTDDAKWNKFLELHKAAGRFLANLDTMTSINAVGVSYSAEGLASALNAALADLESIRYNSQATVCVASFEKNADGNYVIQSVYDSSISDIATVYTKAYDFGDDVTFVAPEYQGYEFVGYATGKKAEIGKSVGGDYSSYIENANASVTEHRTTKEYISYTFFYVPGEVSSIVNTKDGKFNYLKAKTSNMPTELGSISYPSYTEHADSDTDFNYVIEGNDITVWSTQDTTAVQLQFLPFYAELDASTDYVLTYDVAGTEPENVQLSIYNSSFTGGNGNEATTYVVNESGDIISTNSVDKGTVYLKLELLGDARNGKKVRISDVCLSKADSNELYIDTTKGYPAVFSAPAGEKTAVSYNANGVESLVATTSYSTLTYDQYQLLPYYIDLQPNSTYEFTYELSGLSSEQVQFELYSSEYVAGNGSSLHYYNLTGSGVTFTTGPNDDAVGQLRIKFTNDPSVAAGAKVTVKNLNVVNIDSKTTIFGLYNETQDLGIPVKEGYKFCGWSAKSNNGGSAHGVVNSVYDKQVYSYTFGPNIDIITADWEADTCVVIFRGEDGMVISEQNIIYGNSATAPSASDVPEKFGHTFVGWDTEFATVTKNLIIEPIYEQKDITVIVNSDASEIFEGSTTNVSAMFEPNEDGISAVEWTSNNNSVATVDENGVVTGISAGTAAITGTITYDGRTYSASTNIKVNPVEVTGISINTAPDKTTYFVGETFDPTGLSLLVTYNNGETAVIDSDYTLNTVNTSYAGAKTVRVTYEGYTTTTRITVVDIVMTSIEITKLPYVTTYFVGDAEFEADGIVVVAHYNNGDVAELDLGDLEFVGFDTSSVGNVTITVCYEDFEDTFEINVAEPSIIGITIKNHPAKKSYFVGDEADYTGLKLIATYSNGTTAEISDGYSVSGFDSETAGTKTLTVDYEGMTANFTVEVKPIELTSIEIVTPAEKTEYFVGEEADYAGLTIKANYNNGTSAMVEGYTVSGFDSQTAGQKTITVEYEGKTVTFTVNVKAIELVSIVIATNPAKTEYYTNEAFDSTGLTLTATYNNGTTATITEGFAVGAVDMATAGTKNVTVTYEGKTANFNITVNALYVTNVDLNTMPNKTEYMIGELEDNTGLTLKVTYNDGSTKVVNDGFTVFGFDSSVKGTVTMMVEYEGYYVTYDVTIIGKADFSKVDDLLAKFKAEDPSKYTNYDEVYLMYVYDFANTTLPLSKEAYTSEKDQPAVDALYDELKGYYDMLEPIPDEPVIVERFEIVGGASVKTQGGVNYIVGLQPSLTKAKFQSTYTEYENVTVEIKMTTARYLGTGSTVTVKSKATGEVIKEYVIVIYGDVDGTATINARDSLAVMNSISGAADSLTGAAKLAANVEGTRTTINAKDVEVLDAVAGGTMTIDQSTGKGVEI